MIIISTRPGLLAVLAVACASLETPAQTPSKAFVHASRAALRAQPSRTAPVIDYLTTNTEVEIRTRAGEWCGVAVASIKDPGFIACGLLGDAALTLETIDAKASSYVPSRERLDWEFRGFWVSPSLRRFEAVGYAMEQALLLDDPRVLKDPDGAPVRTRNPEFEAMKARLQKRITVEPGAPLARSWMNDGASEQEPLKRALKHASLPEIRPSYFRDRDPLLVVALRPFTLADSGEIGLALSDALSAVNRVPIRTRVAAPLAQSHSGEVGIWDVSKLAVTFDRELTLHAVTSRGTATGLRIKSLLAPLGRQPCIRAKLEVNARPMTGWNSAIVGWVASSAPPGAAVVTTQQAGGSGKFEKLTVENVDLDGDKVADFSIWAGLAPAVVQEETGIFWKAVYANVAGKWVLMTYKEGEDCT